MSEITSDNATENRQMLRKAGWWRWKCPCCGPKPLSDERARAHRTVRRENNQALHEELKEMQAMSLTQEPVMTQELFERIYSRVLVLGSKGYDDAKIADVLGFSAWTKVGHFRMSWEWAQQHMDKLEVPTAMLKLKMTNLKAIMPSLEAAYDAFLHALEYGTQEQIDEAIKSYNGLMDAACVAAWEDTKDRNSLESIKTAFARRGEFDCCNNPCGMKEFLEKANG